MKTFWDLKFRPHRSKRPGHLHAMMDFPNGHSISVTRGGLNDGDADHPYEALTSEGENPGYLTVDGVNDVMAHLQRLPQVDLTPSS